MPAAGASVAVLGRNTERGEACAGRIVSMNGGGSAKFFAADAIDPTSLRVAHQAVVAELGPPTILVNAAGGNDPKVTVTPERAFEAITPDD